MKVMKDCHMCGGSGEGNCFHGWHPNVPCDWCNGTGQIPDEKKRRRKRMKRRYILSNHKGKKFESKLLAPLIKIVKRFMIL